MEDRCQHEAGGDDDDEAGEDGVETGEHLAGLGLQLRRRAHAGKDHRGVEECVGQRHAFETGVAGDADGQAEGRKGEPQADGIRHAPRESGPWDDFVLVALEGG